MNYTERAIRQLDRYVADPSSARDSNTGGALSYDAIAWLWFAKSGELLSRSRVAQIVEIAEKKMRMNWIPA